MVIIIVVVVVALCSLCPSIILMTNVSITKCNGGYL